MTTCIYRFLAFVVLLATLSAPVYSHAQLNDENARHTLTRYFYALKNGDTQSMSALMTDGLRHRHSALLANSQYGDTLVRIYSDAEFTIDEIQDKGSDKAIAQVSFRLGTSQAQRLQIVLVSDDGGDNYMIEQIDQ